VAGVALQSASVAVAERRGKRPPASSGVFENDLADLRFEYSFHALEEMVETDRPSARPGADRIIDSADDLLDQGKPARQAQRSVCGRGTHEIFRSDIGFKGIDRLLNPVPTSSNRPSSAGNISNVGIVGEQVVAAPLAGADRGYALELAVPVEYPAGEGAFDFRR